MAFSTAFQSNAFQKNAFQIAAAGHDVFAEEVRPTRVRSQPSEKQKKYELQQAIRAIEDLLKKEREEALLANQLAGKEAHKIIAENAMARAQQQAALLARARDDEEAITLLMM